MPDTGTVKVRTMDGKVWTIPKDNLFKAQMRGAVLVTEDSGAKKTASMNTPPNSFLGGFAEKFGGEPTFKEQKESTKGFYSSLVHHPIETLKETGSEAMTQLKDIQKEVLSQESGISSMKMALRYKQLREQGVPVVRAMAMAFGENSPMGFGSPASEFANKRYARGAGQSVAEILQLLGMRGGEVPEEAAAPKPGIVKSTMRSLTRSGEDVIKKAEEKRTEQVTEQEANYQQKLQDAKVAHEDKLNELEAKRKSDIQQLGKDYAEAKNTAEKQQAAQSRVSQMRDYLSQKKQELLSYTQSMIRNVHDNVRTSLDKRWADLRSKMGDEEINLKPIADAVQYAQENILRGSPETIKVFKSILQESEPGLGDASVFRGMGQLGREGGTPLGRSGISASSSSLALNPEIRMMLEQMGSPSGEGSIGFADARGYYTELGEKMYGHAAEIPGDVYHALRYVRESIDRELMKATEEQGAAQEYSALKKDWSEYERDFRDMRSVAGGASPIGRIMRAKDPGFVEQQVLGKAYDRLLKTMLKYKGFGTDVKAITDLRKTSQDLAQMPKAKSVAMPQRPELPVRKPAPEFKVPDRPSEIPPLDREKLRADAVRNTAIALKGVGGWRLAIGIEEMVRLALQGNFYGGIVRLASMVGGPMIVGRILESPSIIRWISAEEKSAGRPILAPLKQALYSTARAQSTAAIPAQAAQR